MPVIDTLAKRGGNQAVAINPPSSFIDIHLTQHGSNWLWTAFSLFCLFTLYHAAVFIFTSSKKTPLRKAVLVIPFFINIVMLFAYYTYASNLGYTGIPTEFRHITTSEGLNVRQIFYSKFIGWFVAWPLVMVLYQMNLTDASKYQHPEPTDENYDSSATGGLFVTFINFLEEYCSKFVAIEVWVLGLLVGALIQSTYKWGYFTIAAFAQLITMSLIVKSLVSSATGGLKGKMIGRGLIGFQLIVWMLQSICWGLSEGGNVIQPDSEAVFYGIMDLCTFAFIPTLLTYINLSSLDEGFFHKFDVVNKFHNEKIVDSPRHSGDTAVPTNPNEPVAEPEQAV
jgi:bacteriorhodopsin